MHGNPTNLAGVGQTMGWTPAMAALFIIWHAGLGDYFDEQYLRSTKTTIKWLMAPLLFAVWVLSWFVGNWFDKRKSAKEAMEAEIESLKNKLEKLERKRPGRKSKPRSSNT